MCLINNVSGCRWLTLTENRQSRRTRALVTQRFNDLYQHSLFFLDLLHVMQNEGGIIDIILQEMAWLIILMTIHEQPLSHENEWGLLILFFYFYQDVMSCKIGRNTSILWLKITIKELCFVISCINCIIKMIRKFFEYMLCVSFKWKKQLIFKFKDIYWLLFSSAKYYVW